MKSHTTVITASGYTTLVAAPTSPAFIAVTGYQIMSADSLTVKLTSASTDKATIFTPPGVSCPPGREPYLHCAPGEALRINLSDASAGGVAVNIQYAIRG